ncbi:NUMOD4 domain-containing protein [Nocardia otitidiscaviarum]|uniref:NUMOD4 domain-containing protein n=1 Tax=Nocardia otitidiscaviarum TaxID=1823 RepID=UPI0005B83136|nr:NUMOD4 domain-containing protein [Nocardia otitidiscaviarum]
MTTDEQWRPIPGYEGHYEASNLGRIRSITRMITTKAGVRQILRGRILTPTTDRGKQRVSLSVDSHHEYRLVSRLVGETWCGIPGKGYCIAHVSDDHDDNRVTNLMIAHTRDIAARAGKKNRGRRRTHCRRGHPLVDPNVQYNRSGSRQCRRCLRMTPRERAEARPADLR